MNTFFPLKHNSGVYILSAEESRVLLAMKLIWNSPIFATAVSPSPVAHLILCSRMPERIKRAKLRGRGEIPRGSLKCVCGGAEGGRWGSNHLLLAGLRPASPQAMATLEKLSVSWGQLSPCNFLPTVLTQYNYCSAKAKYWCVISTV